MKHKEFYSKGRRDALTSGLTMPTWNQIGPVPGPALAAYTDGWRDGREAHRQYEDKQKNLFSLARTVIDRG